MLKKCIYTDYLQLKKNYLFHQVNAKNFLTKSNFNFIINSNANIFNPNSTHKTQKNSKTSRNTFLTQIPKKMFTFTLPEEENYHSTKNKPNRLIELNLKKSDNEFVTKMNFPFNDEIQISIFNKLMKNQNIDIISDKIKYEVLIKILLVSNHIKENSIYFVIDDDEDGKQILNLLNDLELELVWIKDDTQNELFNTPITNRFLFNYKNFKVGKIPKFRDNSYLIFLSENKKNMLPWLSSDEMKNNLQKSSSFFLNKNTDDSQSIQSILKKINPKNISMVKMLTEKQNENLFNFGIKHSAMCVMKSNITIVCLENCKKFLRLGMKVLIICDKEKDRQELIISLGEIKEFVSKKSDHNTNKNISSELIQIKLNSELLNRDDIAKYDVVIEYPFISIDMFKERRKYLKRMKWGEAIMISFYYEKESYYIEELRKMNFALVRVKNLLSAAWLYDDNERLNNNLIKSDSNFDSNFDLKSNSQKTSNTNTNIINGQSNINIIKSSESKQNIKRGHTPSQNQNQIQNRNSTQASTTCNIPPLEIFNKLDNFIKIENKLPSFTDDTNITDFVNLEDLFHKVQKNKYLQKQIFFHFMRQNFKKFFNLEYESISLITGEPGWYTVKIISKTPKQMEERYSVIKFLIQQGVCTMDYEDKVFRVYEKFDHVLDIPCEKYKELKKNAETVHMDVEILNELPIFHRNQFSDLIRHKNKFEEKVKEDMDE